MSQNVHASITFMTQKYTPVPRSAIGETIQGRMPGYFGISIYFSMAKMIPGF